ncbi:MAG: SAM-dependent methyltransferase [Magnetospirillum sp.]|nr:SAM-dependent methyltransferase [Magnetospirillum sp.]
MNADFLDAHDRHWHDAERLFADARLANADHLYGLAAECGLKRLMQAFGMRMDNKGKPGERSDRDHADKIWCRYETYRSGHRHGPSYSLPGENPFDDWDVSQRYANRSEFALERAARHRSGAKIVRELIAKAQKDGLL